jgi:hypothetical protein
VRAGPAFIIEEVRQQIGQEVRAVLDARHSIQGAVAASSPLAYVSNLPQITQSSLPDHTMSISNHRSAWTKSGGLLSILRWETRAPHPDAEHEATNREIEQLCRSTLSRRIAHGTQANLS